MRRGWGALISMTLFMVFERAFTLMCVWCVCVCGVCVCVVCVCVCGVCVCVCVCVCYAGAHLRDSQRRLVNLIYFPVVGECPPPPPPPPPADLANLLAINAVQDVSIHSRQLTSKLHTGSLPIRAGSSKNGQVVWEREGEGVGNGRGRVRV